MVRCLCLQCDVALSAPHTRRRGRGAGASADAAWPRPPQTCRSGRGMFPRVFHLRSKIFASFEGLCAPTSWPARRWRSAPGPSPWTSLRSLRTMSLHLRPLQTNSPLSSPRLLMMCAWPEATRKWPTRGRRKVGGVGEGGRHESVSVVQHQTRVVCVWVPTKGPARGLRKIWFR